MTWGIPQVIGRIKTPAGISWERDGDAVAVALVYPL